MQPRLPKPNEKLILVGKLIADYATPNGYTNSTLYQMVIKICKDQGESKDKLMEMGVIRSGRQWFCYPSILRVWMDVNMPKGPHFGINRIPYEWDDIDLLEQGKGWYQLQAVIKCLRPDTVTYNKVLGAFKRDPETARKTIGVDRRNRQYAVKMEIFKKWYKRIEFPFEEETP